MREISPARDPGADPREAPPDAVRRLEAWVWAALAVAAVTALGILVRPALALPDLALVYLLCITLVAARLGRGPAVGASALSVAAYDFFFVEPVHTFAVHETRHLITFATMFAVGVVVSGLADRMRRQARATFEAGERARLEEARSALLASVSHDLRTPLAAILGSASALRDGGAELDPAARAEHLATLIEEAERMERLIAHTLDMTRLQGGPLALRREWVPLDEVVAGALGRVGARLEGRPVTLELPADLPLVRVDPTFFPQLVVNLLENACRHTPPGSPIGITGRVGPDTVTLEVADRGPGLAPGDEARVFEKFGRGSGARAPGFGLGLSICRAIAASHGGRVEARNREAGGAVFAVVLPREEAPPARLPAEGGPP